MLVVLNRHAMQTSTISKQLVYWIDKLVDVYELMHWRVGCVLNRHVGWRLLTDALTCWLFVESTYWLTFTNWCIDELVGCLIDMLVDNHWCIDVLVGVLNRHVSWHLLMPWWVGWYVKLTCWLTITDALTYWLVCWTDMMVDVYWCTDVLIGSFFVFDSFSNWYVECSLDLGYK